MAASPSVPVAASKSPTTAGNNVHKLHSNGGGAGHEASSALSDILADLQDEDTDAAEEKEDPETHYNLGIAFKEMGLLDEPISPAMPTISPGKILKSIGSCPAFQRS